MKRIASLALATLVLIGSAACSDGENSSSSDLSSSSGETQFESETLVWSAPTTKKYTLNEKPLSETLDLSIVMCKNETEGVQLMITPNENVTSYDVTIGDLTDGKNIISKDKIGVYREHYLYMSQTNHSSTVGYYPDPLVPMSVSKAAGENVIAKGQNQGVLIEVTTEADTPSGEYKGTVTLTLNGEKQEIPLTVSVKDVTLPQTHNAKRAFAIWDSELSLGTYSNVGYREYMHNAYELLLDYGISPTDLPNADYLSTEEQIELAIEYANRDDVTCFSLPYVATSVNAEGYAAYVSFDYAHLKTLLSGLIKASTNENNLLKKVYLYLSELDEQEPDAYWKLRDTNARFKALKEELAADESLFDGSNDAVKESLLAIEHIVTLTQTEDVYGGEEAESGLYTACPQYQLVANDEYYYTMTQRMAEGNTYWWYGCNVPWQPNPSLHIDDDLLIAREISYMQKYYGINGELYWCVNINGVYDSILGEYTTRDVWKDATSVGAAGDGYLIYPAAKYGEEYATASFAGLRLTALRDGVEDYDLLCILEEELSAAAKKYDVDINLNEYLGDWYASIFNGVLHDDNYELLSAFREEIIDLIIALQSDGNALIVSKTNDITHRSTITVYANEGSRVAINGESLSERKHYGGAYFETQVVAEADANFAEISVNGRIAHKYIGQFTQVVENFNALTDVSNIEVSEYRKKTGVTLSVNEDIAYSISGKSLKAEMKYLKADSYKPEFYINVTGGGAYADYGGYDKIGAYLYNAGEESVLVNMQIGDDSLRGVSVATAILTPHEWTKISAKDLTGKIDMSRFVCVSFEFENDEIEKTIYVDNITLGKASSRISAAESPTETTADFGLYGELYDPDGKTLENGLLCDFESMDELPWFVTVSRFTTAMEYTASVQTNADYVTNGKGSLKLDYTLQAWYDPAILPSIYFRLPKSERDFSENVTLEFDIYNASDADLVYQIKTYNVFDNTKWEYTYTETQADGTTISEFTVAPHGDGMTHVSVTLNVDYGTYYGGEVPKDVRYIRLVLPTTGNGEMTMYLDNIKIVRN